MIRFTGLATVGYAKTFQASLHPRFDLTFTYSKRAEASIGESRGILCVVDVLSLSGTLAFFGLLSWFWEFYEEHAQATVTVYRSP